MLTSDVLRHRLANQQLTRATFEQPDDVVAWLGAVQAQDYAGAKWALGQRLRSATDAAIEAAFSQGSILRTHVMRPTWHFVAPADIRWLLALSAPRVKAALASADRALGLDAAVVARSKDAIARALEGGRQLTRPELATALGRVGIATNAQALAHMVMHAELDGVICSGPRRGTQFTYALLKERVPPTRSLARDEALAELAGRYFTSHGPATIADFVWWSGLTVADARRGIAASGARLVQESVGGTPHWLAPATAPPIPPGTVYLLPNYDEYTVAYKDCDAFFDAARAGAPTTRDRVPFGNVVVLDGRVAGWWKRTLRARSVAVDARWFVEPSAAQRRALAAAVERYAAFLGLTVG